MNSSRRLPGTSLALLLALPSALLEPVLGCGAAAPDGSFAAPSSSGEDASPEGVDSSSGAAEATTGAPAPRADASREAPPVAPDAALDAPPGPPDASFVTEGGGSSHADAGGDPGQVLFNGDFETGDLSQWTGEVTQCQSGRITVYSAATAPAGAPVPRQGTYAARFDVLDTDVSPCTPTDNPRAQVSSPKTLLDPGQPYWEAWSLYVPTSLPAIACGASCSNPFFVFQEDYGAPYNGSPPIGWGIEQAGGAGVLSIRRGAQYGYDQVWSAPLVRNEWVDFVVHKQMANTTTGGGFVEAWVDGVAITFPGCNCARLETQTMHSDATSSYGLYLNSYREKGMFAEGVIYFDAARVGTSRQSVEP